MDCLFWVFTSWISLWLFVSLLLKALVSFCLRAWGLLPEPRWRLPATLFLAFSLRMVRFLAMFFLTTLIFESLLALEEAALEFLRFLSSSLSLAT